MTPEEQTIKKNEINTTISNIRGVINELFTKHSDLPSDLKKPLFSYQHYLNSLDKSLISQDASEDILFYVNKMLGRAQELLLSLTLPRNEDLFSTQTRIDGNLIRIAEKLHAITNFLAKQIRVLPITSFAKKAYKNAFIAQDNIISSQRKIDEIRATTSRLFDDVQDAQNEIKVNSSDLANIKDNIKNLDERIKNIDKEITSFITNKEKNISDIIKSMKDKQNEINSLAGIMSGTAIHGSYSQCAKTEKSWADNTRYVSFGIMVIVIGLIGYSLYESTTDDFDFKTALFRMIFSIALSIPAAYAARESAKHRNQQYHYQRLAMDLKSITPYLSSLPDEIQHKLKADMANKIFGHSQVESSISEAYPINIQELLIAIIGKLQDSKKESEAPPKAISK
ncbi:hypothetical protein ACEUD0_16745 [Aeromonas veronii]